MRENYEKNLKLFRNLDFPGEYKNRSLPPTEKFVSTLAQMLKDLIEQDREENKNLTDDEFFKYVEKEYGFAINIKQIKGKS